MAVNFASLGERTSYYRFSASTLARALQQMTRLGPSDGDGHHAADCDMRADIMQGLQTGIVSGTTQQSPEMGWMATALISQASFRYGFVFRFPDWTNIARLTGPVRAEWARYTSCLWAHERGHVTTAMTVLRQFLAEFQNLRIAGSGASAQAAEADAQSNLRTQVSEVFDRLAFRNQQASDRYDARTRHGRTQGAQLRTTLRRGSRNQ